MNDASDIEVILSSDCDYDMLIAEMYVDGKFVALLNQDRGVDSLVIEFPEGNVQENEILRKIDLGAFEEALVLAKQKIR